VRVTLRVESTPQQQGACQQERVRCEDDDDEGLAPVDRSDETGGDATVKRAARVCSTKKGNYPNNPEPPPVELATLKRSAEERRQREHEPAAIATNTTLKLLVQLTVRCWRPLELRSAS
jgi:hypothetical protein